MLENLYSQRKSLFSIISINSIMRRKIFLKRYFVMSLKSRSGQVVSKLRHNVDICIVISTHFRHIYRNFDITISYNVSSGPNRVSYMFTLASRQSLHVVVSLFSMSLFICTCFFCFEKTNKQTNKQTNKNKKEHKKK